ncbi:MAG TPA: hypothetical protein DCO72_10055, partial [Ruminococcus sp.]|nr:hypothetical protein [Ruminococcus sp.]
VSVTEDGKEYTLTMSGEGGQVTADDLILFIQSDANIYDYAKEGVEGDTGIKNGNLNIEISSIKVDGKEISYTRSGSALTTGDNGVDLRLNIYNKHQRGSETYDIDPSFTCSTGIEVTFKTTGLFVPAETSAATDAPTDGATDAPTEGGDNTAETTAPTEDSESGETTASTTSTTAATTKATAAANNNSSSASNSGSASTTAASSSGSASTDTSTNADTNDEGVTVAVTMLTIAGAAALVSKKRK